MPTFKCTKDDIERLVKVEIELKDLLISEHVVKGTFVHNRLQKSLNMLSTEVNVLVDRMNNASN